MLKLQFLKTLIFPIALQNLQNWANFSFFSYLKFFCVLRKILRKSQPDYCRYVKKIKVQAKKWFSYKKNLVYAAYTCAIR